MGVGGWINRRSKSLRKTLWRESVRHHNIACPPTLHSGLSWNARMLQSDLEKKKDIKPWWSPVHHLSQYLSSADADWSHSGGSVSVLIFLIKAKPKNTMKLSNSSLCIQAARLSLSSQFDFSVKAMCWAQLKPNHILVSAAAQRHWSIL